SELKSGSARDRKNADIKYGIAMPNEKSNNASAPSDADPTVPTYIINDMKSAPPKQVEQPTANAEPMNIILSVSTHPTGGRRDRKYGRRQTPDASELTAIPTPSSKMPAPAAMLSGRLQCSMIPELSSF